MKTCTGSVSPLTPTGRQPPWQDRRGRRTQGPWRCGGLAEPGQELCAAHLRQKGLRKCPKHGWVEPTFQSGDRPNYCPRWGYGPDHCQTTWKDGVMQEGGLN